jgi:hypothetical protein
MARLLVSQISLRSHFGRSVDVISDREDCGLRPKTVVQKRGYCSPVLMKLFASFREDEAVPAGSSRGLTLPLPDAPARACKTARALGWAEADVPGARLMMDLASARW